MSHMLVYLWYEKSRPNEVKFGERFVNKTFLTPWDKEKEVWKRIRQSLGVRKDLIDDGEIVLAGVWDATKYARKHGRLYKGARVDDYIRSAIGGRKGRSEVHKLSPKKAKRLINKQLNKRFCFPSFKMRKLAFAWFLVKVLFIAYIVYNVLGFLF